MLYEGNQIDGWMTEEELNWLYETSSKMESAVEIGSWKGRSTHAILNGCQGPVFAVDYFKGSPEERQTSHVEALEKDIFKTYWKNLVKFPNLIVFRMESQKAANFFKYGSVDMVFIDGDHSRRGFLTDFLSWRPIAKKLICGHDRETEGIKEVFEWLKIDPSPEVGTIWSLSLE